jgi:hypothetical protein
MQGLDWIIAAAALIGIAGTLRYFFADGEPATAAVGNQTVEIIMLHGTLIVEEQ